MEFSQLLKSIDTSAMPVDATTKKLSKIWAKFTEQLSQNPMAWLPVVQEGQKQQIEMVASLQNPATPTKPSKDKRFSDEQWQSQPFFSMLMQSYLINADVLRTIAGQVDLPEKDKKLLLYLIEQYINAISPTNFPATNPTVIQEAIDTGGDSLVRGMKNLMSDMQEGVVKNTDTDAFCIGKNIATTEGQVIYQNSLMQIIEYKPQTEKVHAKPLLIVPPCINKYYILDLTEKKSFVKHIVDNGYRVFLISWVNADTDIAHLRFDDYLRDGIMTAIDVVQNISKQPKINTLGFCIGGTLLSCALAILAQDDQHPAQSVTLLATMLDFSDTGEIGLFIDEESIAEKEARFVSGGLIDGKTLAQNFAYLRPNDLVWPYVIDNYYRGKTPPAFDLLFWNADSTNLPGPMFTEYLRMTYLENKISKGTAVMCGTPIILDNIKAPFYAVACEKDHIVPWQTAYQSALLASNKCRFVLAASGHIAGIVNAPTNQKGWYKTSTGVLPSNHQTWQDKSSKNEGSWWIDWFQWLKAKSGTLQAAPTKMGNTRYSPIEPAPGRYVTQIKPAISKAGPFNIERKENESSSHS